MRKLELVSVEWFDACSRDPWTPIEDSKGCPKVCYSVGYLIHNDKDSITVAGTVSEDGDACCAITIPKRSITAPLVKLSGGDKNEKNNAKQAFGYNPKKINW